jgi:hypothetical protein
MDAVDGRGQSPGQQPSPSVFTGAHSVRVFFTHHDYMIVTSEQLGLRS